MAKCLGPIESWEKKLRITNESGYNLIHFTPIQELGGSRSGYSLANQLKVNPDFGAKVNYNDVEKVIQKCRREWGIASICDIVLNHTANESEWLREHPESTYSCANCPHLRPAFLLDASLAIASEEVAAGLLETMGVPQIVDNEQHVDALRHQLHTNYFQKAKVWELYQVNTEALLKRFNDDMRKGPPKKSDKDVTADDIKIVQDPEYKRFGSTIDYPAAVGVFNNYR